MTTLLTINATPNIAIACDMTAAEDSLPARLAEYQRLFDHALVERTSTESSTTFLLADRPGVREWVLDLVRREAACCPFLSYEVDLHGGQIRWRTDGVGAADWVALDAVFAQTADRTATELAQDLTDRTGVPHLVPDPRAS